MRDLEASMAAWLAAGVGPWLTIGPLEQAMVFRGEATTPTITIGFANSGDLQIELIEQTGAAPSAYKEFLDTGREGFHHLAWWAEDYDAAEAEVRAGGLEVVLEGDTGVARFLYAEADPRVATCLELMELNDMTGWLAREVKAAADGWDGATDPIRTLL